MITTVGLGDEPTRRLGQLIAGGAFIAAATCWFGIGHVVVELGLSRLERNALVREALRRLPRRRGPKLLHDNEGGMAL